MPHDLEAALLKQCVWYSKEDMKLLVEGIAVAYRGHEGQVRKSSNLPYVIHPLEVALGLEERFAHPSLTIAGLLHDVVEDSDCIRIGDVYDTFGEDIGFLVDAVTKTHLHFHRRFDFFDSYLDKLLFGGLRDVRVFLLKIADRDNNLQTLSSLKNHKQLRISFETQAIFTPLRRILSYDDPAVTLTDLQSSFVAFSQDNQLMTPASLSQHLFHYTFEGFTRDIFQQVYAATENVIWEMNDMERYTQLCENEEFDKSVEVLSLSTDGTTFRAIFKFRGAHILGPDTKIRVSSFNT